MMFMLPLKGNRAQCRKCSARFKLDIDEQGNVYITELQRLEDKGIQSLEECFQILELKPDALPIDIRSAYKRKIMEYHPDKVGNLGAKIKQVAEDETRRINAAYAKLEEQGKV
jgi:preprotein translocase subunit Sec63